MMMILCQLQLDSEIVATVSPVIEHVIITSLKLTGFFVTQICFQ